MQDLNPIFHSIVPRNNVFEIISFMLYSYAYSFKGGHSEIEWIKINGLRHRVLHEYFGVDLGIIWEIIQRDLRAFKQQLRDMRHSSK